MSPSLPGSELRAACCRVCNVSALSGACHVLQESKLMTYPQFILSLGEIMELNFWPLKRILQSILRSQRSY